MKQYHIISGLAGIAIIAIFYILLIGPALDESGRLETELDKAERNLTDFNRTMLEAPEFFKMHRDILSQKKTLTSQLYTKEDLIRLFDDFEKKARKHDLKITEITPSVEELLLLNRKLPSEIEPQMLNLTIYLRGGYIAAGNFIREMEEQKFYQGLDHCRIANNDPYSAYSDIKFSFRAVLGTIKES